MNGPKHVVSHLRSFLCGNVNVSIGTFIKGIDIMQLLLSHNLPIR